MASDAISLLEGGLRRVTDAFRYAFIAYVSGSDVPMDAIYLYIDGKPVFHGAKGLSIAQRIDVSSLKQHFLTDIPLAKTCFDVDELRRGVIRLRNGCIKAFGSSALLSSLTKLALFLDELSSKSVKLAELRTAVRSLDLSISVDKLVAYLAMLFPAKVGVYCRGTNVYDYVVQNFEKLRQSVSQSDASKIFLAAVSELCTSIDDAVVELSSSLRLLRTTMGEEKRVVNVFEEALNSLKKAGAPDAEAVLLNALGTTIESLEANATLNWLGQVLSDDVKRAVANALAVLKPVVEVYGTWLKSCAESLISLSIDNAHVVLGSLLLTILVEDQRFSEIANILPRPLIAKAKSIVKNNAYVLMLCRVYSASLD